jgi:putative ABC transport system ATP-binding protein
MQMIELSDIHFHYPKSDFNLHIGKLHFEKGSKTAIIGPSGFGKTTMLNLLAGILLPDSGNIKVEDELVNSLSEKERRNFRIQKIGFVFQDFRLIPYLNILDNILLPFRINNILKINSDTLDSVQSLTKDLGIAPKLNKHPSKLSHGERQRVAICRALINKPQVILADEPTGNLDPENKRKIMSILFNYVEQFESTIVTVTHDHNMLKGFSNTVDFANFQRTDS